MTTKLNKIQSSLTPKQHDAMLFTDALHRDTRQADFEAYASKMQPVKTYTEPEESHLFITVLFVAFLALALAGGLYLMFVH